jgi:hypothetical protein
VPMTRTEIAFGYLFGHAGVLEPPDCLRQTPREALERVISLALRRPPCGVAFSGGRDSSAVLAVATHVARRDGLAEPIPITKVFPGVKDSQESEWQETVLHHLGLEEWQRVVLTDELDLVGPLAGAHLVDHGVVWPPTVHGDAPVVELLPGGSLLDGEGGDEVLGVAAHRIAPVTRLVRAPRSVRRHGPAAALEAAAPPPIRNRRIRRHLHAVDVPWLRPAARDALVAELARVEGTAPLSFAASVRTVPRRRSQVVMAHNRRALARRHDVDVASPLLHPEFVHALARDGGFFGRGDRTAALRALVADLLPDVVLTRATKAVFGGAFWADPTRAFVEAWTGDGLDDDLVVVDELRRLWLSDRHNALTSALLQAAWLATNAPSNEDSV